MELPPRYQNDPGYGKKIFGVMAPSAGRDFGTVLAVEGQIQATTFPVT